MSNEEKLSLRTVFDEIAETEGDREFNTWWSKLFDHRREIADCAGELIEGRGQGTYVGFLKGSFNFSFRISFGEGFSDALIRFPKPGHTDVRLMAEKVENEVHTIEYLRQHTTIPLPTIHDWGTKVDSTTKTAARRILEFGPFIVMDFVEGILLSSIMKIPDQVEMVLNPSIDNQVLNKIYLQLADYMLQLSQLRLDSIGAISRNDRSDWCIKRPLTYNMNELASVTFYPFDRFPLQPIDHASEYFRLVANEHLVHLQTQRNLSNNEAIAKKRYIARRQFAKLIPKYCIDDNGPFLPFCDDLRPANMLVNPETLQITAVFDLEFTNSMPAQFAYDPPWWLLLAGPEMWLDRCAFQEFITQYEPRMDQFLRALEHVEKESGNRQQPSDPPLSAKMRDSWQTGRFWFNYAARKSFEVDSVYWAALHDDSALVLDDQAQAEIDAFAKEKMEQLDAYDEECSSRFPLPSE